MSYCRPMDGTPVYMYPHIHGGIICCGCSISNRKEIKFNTRTGAIMHLIKHREANEYVPDFAFTRLEEEREKFGDDV